MTISFTPRPIFDINPKQTALVPLDLLRYFYYTGMLHIGLKCFNEALDSLQMVEITTHLLYFMLFLTGVTFVSTIVRDCASGRVE